MINRAFVSACAVFGMLALSANAAGCHFWTDEPLPVVANEHLLSIHVKDGGRKVVHLPRKCAKVVDLLTDRVVATDCTDFEDDFASPDTKIYETVYK